ncbi:MAG: helix-turn-helix domain-containing protein [Pseudomonadales bacterium]|nr:helix-turn-helix domain-containing protein [Pseudomonadales bacterium]
MDFDEVAGVLKELGHPHRLRIFKHLVKAGFEGLPVGVLREDLGIPNSSMTHHINSLVKAGLIVQQRRGRVLQCIPKYRRLWDVISFLQSECCINEADIEGKT